jgi:hypothetical protein
VPALALLVVMQFTAGAIGAPSNVWFFAFKPIWLFRIMNGYSLTVSSASVGALLLLIYMLGKRRLLILTSPGRWIGAGFALLYIVIPSRLLDTAFTDLRMITAAALILPAFCALTLPSSRWRQAVFGAVSAITLANLAVISVVWLSYRADYAAMIESFGKLDRGARVLVGTTGPGYDPPFHDLTKYPMYYAPTLAAVYADAFVASLFTVAGKQPLLARADVQQLTISDGGLVPVTILTDIAAGRPAGELPSFIRSWDRDFDYLYLLGPRVDNPMPERLTELDSAARFTLYKIRRAP